MTTPLVKDELVAVEGRLNRKIETEANNLASNTLGECGRVHRRAEALARHVGYTFEPAREDPQPECMPWKPSELHK